MVESEPYSKHGKRMFAGVYRTARMLNGLSGSWSAASKNGGKELAGGDAAIGSTTYVITASDSFAGASAGQGRL